MAVHKPIGDDARKRAVHKRYQLKTKVEGEAHWTKRSKGVQPVHGARSSCPVDLVFARPPHL